MKYAGARLTSQIYHWLFLLSTLCFVQGSALASDAKDLLSLHQEGGKASLLFANHSGLNIVLNPFSNAPNIETVKMISSVHSLADEYTQYVVIELGGPTTSGTGKGHCGAGYENSLVWLKLYGSVVIGSQSVLISSCAVTLDSDYKGIVDGKIEFSISSYSDKRNYQLAYNEKYPENGFLLTSNAVKDEGFK